MNEVWNENDTTHERDRAPRNLTRGLASGAGYPAHWGSGIHAMISTEKLISAHGKDPPES